MKKIILGMVTAGVMAMGGNLEPEWVSAHRMPYGKTVNKDNYIYKGVVNGYIHHGQFSSSFYNLPEKGKGLPKKIVVKQKVPCYVVPKEWNYMSDLLGGRKPSKTEYVKKTSSDEVTLYKIKSRMTGSTQTTRIFNYERIRSYTDPRIKNSTLIAGNSKECLKQPNSETWTVYWKLKGKWVAVAEEKFYISPNKPTTKSTHARDINKNNIVKKSIDEKKKSAKIRIYKYGAPDGYGRSFASMNDCEIERDKLAKSNAGLDYSYKCE